MEAREIANIIYNMSLDMEYADHIEFAEEEIDTIAQEIENAGDSLREALEVIAAQHEDMKDWHKQHMEE